MATLNKVMLIGRLGNNPEKKITTSGKSVVSVSLASSSFYKDEMGNKQENTEWHRLVFWGNLADNLCQYTKKGSLLYVEGRLQTKEWTKDDVRRFTTEIVVSNMQFLDKKETSAESYPDHQYGTTANQPAAASTAPPQTEPKPEDDFIEDDIPF